MVRVRYQTATVMANSAEVLCYGSAVKLKKKKNEEENNNNDGGGGAAMASHKREPTETSLTNNSDR